MSTDMKLVYDSPALLLFQKKTHFFLAIFFKVLFAPTIASQAITTCNCSKPYRLGVNDLSNYLKCPATVNALIKNDTFFKPNVTKKAAQTF